jgi:two-component system sensor histidine kinase AlgZ
MPRTEEAPPEPRPGRLGFLPDFCRIPLVFGVLLTAELLAIVLALATPSPLAGFWERLGVISLYVQLIALGGSAALCLLRPLLGRVDDRLAGIAAWLILVTVAGLITLAAHQLVPWAPDHLFPDDGLAGLMARSLGVASIVSILLLRYLYLHHLWRVQTQAEAEARFQTLQANIQPHFLFNSLNTVASQIPSNPRLAEDLLQDLADLFRAALARGTAASTLGQELELARRYLNIEHQRLGERLAVEWDLDELPLDAPLPPMILQPLVENAVYHGIAPARRPGLIRISGRYRRGVVNLGIRNSLPEDPVHERHRGGHRMGMDNVHQRLAAMYPGEGRMAVSRVEGDWQVRLVFPYPWRER